MPNLKRRKINKRDATIIWKKHQTYFYWEKEILVTWKDYLIPEW